MFIPLTELLKETVSINNNQLLRFLQNFLRLTTGLGIRSIIQIRICFAFFSHAANIFHISSLKFG